MYGSPFDYLQWKRLLHSNLFNQYKHIFIYLFYYLNQDYLWAPFRHGAPHKIYLLVYVVLRFVLFNFQSLDRVYNKWFGGDNITFYAFPKQSNHSANHSGRQRSSHRDFCLHHPSHLFLFPHTSRTWSNTNDLAGMSLLYHCKHSLSSLHSRLIMWMPNKSLQFPFPEFF